MYVHSMSVENISSAKCFVAYRTLVFCSGGSMDILHVSGWVVAFLECSVAYLAFNYCVFHNYCIKFKPPGSRVCNIAIQASSVLRRMFVVCDVGVMTVTLTSLTVWLFDVKLRDTGLKSFPALMSVKCPRMRSLIVLPVCPTYCRPHFEQLIKYTALFVWQL